MVKLKEVVVNATWDRETKLAFCDVCLKEVEAGNRPTTHFNREGWSNVKKNFLTKTGRDYDKTQLKNKWDQMKKDWKVWKELKHGSTGLGWDSTKKIIDASDDWWKEKLQVLPQAKKFRYAGIDPELEDKLDRIFGGVVATREHAWAPSQVPPEASRREVDERKDSSNDQIQDSYQGVQEPAECSQTKRVISLGAKGKPKKKKGDTFLRDEISQLVSACTNSTENNISVPPSITIATCMLEEIPEVFLDIDCYIHSMKLLEDDKKREMFIAMPPDRRGKYLLHFYEMSKGDV